MNRLNRARVDEEMKIMDEQKKQIKTEDKRVFGDEMRDWIMHASKHYIKLLHRGTHNWHGKRDVGEEGCCWRKSVVCCVCEYG